MMLFSREGIPCIFIHILKTVGNSIQRELVDQGLSLDELTTNSKQDGFNRFEVRGKYTTKKHMSISEYFEFKELRKLQVFTVIRHPIQRLVSLYLSPHRHLKYNKSTDTFELCGEVKFNMSKFQNLIDRAKSCADFLSLQFLDIQAIPVDIQILRMESFKHDYHQKPGLNISTTRNKTTFEKHSKILTEDARIKKTIMNSQHTKGINIFYTSN